MSQLFGSFEVVVSGRPILVRRASLPDLLLLYNPRAVIAFDTSALLELLELSESAASDFLDLLESLVGRVVTPETVAREIERLGPQKVAEAVNAVTNPMRSVLNLPEKSAGPANAAYNETRKRLQEEIANLRAAAQAEVEARYSRITGIIAKTLSSPLRESTLAELATTKHRRYREQIPPGYHDYGKTKGDLAFNDLYIWFELIQIATDQSRPIVLFTNERKADWWYKPSIDTLGSALPALREEMRQRADQGFALFYGGLFKEQYEFAKLVAEPSPLFGGFSLAQFMRTEGIGPQFTRRLYDVTAALDMTLVQPNLLSNARIVGDILAGYKGRFALTIQDQLSALAGAYINPVARLRKEIADLNGGFTFPSYFTGDPVAGAYSTFPKAFTDIIGVNDSVSKAFRNATGVSGAFPKAFTDVIGVNDSVSKAFRDAIGVSGAFPKVLTDVIGFVGPSSTSKAIAAIVGLHSPSLRATRNAMIRGLGLGTARHFDIAKFSGMLPPSIASMHRRFQMQHGFSGIASWDSKLAEAVRRAALHMPVIDPYVERLFRLMDVPPEPSELRRMAAKRRRLHTISRRAARRRLRGRRLNLLREDVTLEMRDK